MALKIFKVNGQIRIQEDGVDLAFIPFRNFDFEPTAIEVLLRNTQEGGRPIRSIFSLIKNEAGEDVGDREAVITYLSDFVGFSNAGGSAIPTSDIFHGGFVDYSDLVTKTIPISFTAVGETVLANDSLGPNTFEGELPVGITGILNKSTFQFDFSQLKIGDMVDVRMQLNKVTTISNNQTITVDLHLGLGGFEYSIPFVSEFQYKTSGVRPVNRFNGIYIKDSNTLNNPAEFRISSDGSGSVEVGGWYCKIIRKG